MQAPFGIAVFWALLWGVGYMLPRLGMSVLPVSIVSLMVMTVLFVCSVRIRDFFAPAAMMLIQYMPLFFIPVIVGVVAQKKLLSAHWLLLSFVIIGATLISLLSTAFIYKFFAEMPHKDALQEEEARHD